MRLLNRIRAFISGKLLFRIFDLDRIVFATSYEQCLQKFKKHEALEIKGFKKILFVITGKNNAKTY